MRNVLKFKVDENLPIEIVECLRQNKYDAFTVKEQGLDGASDLNIAEVCKEEERIIVTLDTDFTDVRTYPPEDYSGIIVLRVKKQNRQHIINIFTQAVPLLSSESIKHCLWIVEEHRLRIRGEK